MTILGFLAMVLSLQVIITDLYARRVSNKALLAALGGGGVALVALALASSVAPGPHLLGLLLGLAALLPFHVIGWMGAGDVKYFAVLGFLLGHEALLPIWIGASLLAGLHVAAVHLARALVALLPVRLMALQHQAANHWHQHALVQRVHAARQGRVGIPYAAYLGIACIAWVAWMLAGARV